MGKGEGGEDENEATGRVGDGLVRLACRGFPSYNIFVV